MIGLQYGLMICVRNRCNYWHSFQYRAPIACPSLTETHSSGCRLWMLHKILSPFSEQIIKNFLQYTFFLRRHFPVGFQFSYLGARLAAADRILKSMALVLTTRRSGVDKEAVAIWSTSSRPSLSEGGIAMSRLACSS